MSKNKVYERFKIKVLQIEGVTEYFEIIKLVKSVNLKITRTAWAVFKYCGTETAPLRRNFF